MCAVCTAGQMGAGNDSGALSKMEMARSGTAAADMACCYVLTGEQCACRAQYMLVQYTGTGTSLHLPLNCGCKVGFYHHHLGTVAGLLLHFSPVSIIRIAPVGQKDKDDDRRTAQGKRERQGRLIPSFA
jgi:hypothetical protein